MELPASGRQTPLAFDTWSSRRIGARERLQIPLPDAAGDQVRLTWTDHYGVRAGRVRSRAAVDVRVIDAAGRELAPRAYNSERNSNGLAPDPITFPSAPGGGGLVELREVDGYSDTIELLLERVVDSPVQSPPEGIVVYRAGAEDDATPTTSGGALLAGGGPDSDEATRAAIDAAGRGDVVIVRMDDTGGAYAPYFVGLGARSATEIVLDPRRGNESVEGDELRQLRAAANDGWVESKLDRAELVFFAGGNQTKYVDVFTGTRLATAVNRAVRDRRSVVGGTSAGMHVLGGYVHTPRGRGSSVTSDAALADPYIGAAEIAGTASLDLTRSPFDVPGLENLVFDTHFAQRRRLGRSVVFLARAVTDGLVPLANARVVACDEGTAVFASATGTRVFGPGDATVIRARSLPQTCVDDTPLAWRGVEVWRNAGSVRDVSLEGGTGTLRVANTNSGTIIEE